MHSASGHHSSGELRKVPIHCPARSFASPINSFVFFDALVSLASDLVRSQRPNPGVPISVNLSTLKHLTSVSCFVPPP